MAELGGGLGVGGDDGRGMGVEGLLSPGVERVRLPLICPRLRPLICPALRSLKCPGLRPCVCPAVFCGEPRMDVRRLTRARAGADGVRGRGRRPAALVGGALGRRGLTLWGPREPRSVSPRRCARAGEGDG
eukprot:3587623-Rhodomonas_salina.2